MGTAKKTDRVDVMEKQQIATLAATGKSNRAIARATGRDPKTVASTLKQPEVIEMRENAQELLADKFEQRAETIVDSITTGDIERASLQQKAVSAGILLDKSRLIRGQSNVNIAVMMASLVVEATEARTRTVDTEEG